MSAPRPAILSIQSHVAYGHVGNNAAVLPLQRLGFEVFQLNTVQLAHHPGYGPYSGSPTNPAVLMAMLDGLERIGALDECVAVLSGYLGSVDVGDLVETAVWRVRARRPDAIYCCDPVIGDEDTGVFVKPGIAALFAERLCGIADLVTPNVFELALLAGRAIRTPEDALKGARQLQAMGAGIVLATGLPTDENGEEIGVLAADSEGAWLIRTPRLDCRLHGTGDAFSALFLAHFLKDRRVADALGQSVSAMFSVVKRTVDEGREELSLISAQDDFTSPPTLFTPEQLD